MSKTIEELKQIITEQEVALLIKAQQKLALNAAEMEALSILKIRLENAGVEDVPSIEILQQMYKNPDQSFELQSASNLTKMRIFANFATEFGEKNIINNDTLRFPNLETANLFFSKQARAGHAFLFQQVNCDNYVFSDGNGHYKGGSKAEIMSYCMQNSLKYPEALEDSEEQATHDGSSQLRR